MNREYGAQIFIWTLVFEPAGTIIGVVLPVGPLFTRRQIEPPVG
jgi:hypothetical protein